MLVVPGTEALFAPRVPFFVGSNVKVQVFGRLDGMPGTRRTIREMDRLLDEGRKDPQIQFLARQIARKYKPKDYRGQVDGIFQWVKKNIHYVRDPNDVELIHAPIWTIHAKAGDCDDQSILFSSLAQAIGFKTRWKTIKADKRWPDEFSHIYSQVEIPGNGWVSADTIVDKATLGWEAPGNYPSQVWGGLGMFGEDTTTSSTSTSSSEPLSFGARIKAAFQDTIVNAVDVLGKNGVDQLGKDLGTSSTTTAAPSSAGWVAPVAIAGIGATLLGAVIMMKRRRRR